MTYLKTAFLPKLTIASALLLSACGGGGGGSSTSTPTPTPVADTAAPSVSFSPSTLSVEAGASASSTLTATDARGVTSGPNVSCTNGGVFDVAANRFTAANVTADTQSVCTATASDAAGNQGSAILTVAMIAPVADTTAPVLTFGPATLTVASSMTATSTLTVTENATATVTCTNGGSFNVATNVFTAVAVTESTESVCTATATDEAGNAGTGTLVVTMSPTPVAMTVTLSGKLTYDRVPFHSNQDGLNYAGTFRLPIRQATVELLNASGVALQSVVSDDNGEYSFTVETGEEVRIGVLSEVQKTGENEIDLQVVDNTANDVPYRLDGSVLEVPAQNQTRDLHAGSGWGGSGYTGVRAAAPFALLDTIYGTMEAFIAVDPEIDFPTFDVQWSTLNRSQFGNVDAGEIETSSFTFERRGAVDIPVLRILGDENNDTDEYDVHVVVHEFGHYFEGVLSRSDSTGGGHNFFELLDPRIAFGEGWGNALSGMILDDPLYRDSADNQQSSDQVRFDVESNTFTSTGWYSEGSVQSILYDLFDDADDGADAASYGLGPIYAAFTDPDYANTEAFTTIYAFLEAFNKQPGVVASEVSALTNAQNINSVNGFGVGETNDGGLTTTNTLPVYLPLVANGQSVEMCSVDEEGLFNKLGNRRFFEFSVPVSGDYRFNITRASGAFFSSPTFIVYKDGTALGSATSNGGGAVSRTISLSSGQHVMEVFAAENLNASGLDVCYNVSLEAQ